MSTEQGPRIPRASYRVQFGRGFRFRDAMALAPYLQALGISDLYSSPLVQPRRGSEHGYDVTDPTRLNEELGAPEDFAALSAVLRRHALGLLLDIVPNHMAADAENPWWADLLENGRASRYARFFDVDWHPPSAKALRSPKLILPVLGEPYARALESRQLELAFEKGGFVVRYFDRAFPLDPKSCVSLLEACLERLRGRPDGRAAAARLERLRDALLRLPARNETAARRVARRAEQLPLVKTQLASLHQSERSFSEALRDVVTAINGEAGNAASFDALDRILEDQAYRLAFWKAAAGEVNYRRFFDVSDLVGLRVEAPSVFQARHDVILRLCREGKVTGLRVDHVDGLLDPAGYLARLQRALSGRRGPARRRFYVLVEKILQGDETLPANWPVHGTTGYEFLNAASRVFVDPRGLETLEALSAWFTGAKASFHEACNTGKRRVIAELFRAEFDGLTKELARLAALDRHARELPRRDLHAALVELTAGLPVYRTYINGRPHSPRDRRVLEAALRVARGASRGPALSFLRRVLSLERPRGPVQAASWLRFIQRWQQLSGPVMAKGVEDTACYVHGSLISLNEVGTDESRALPRFGVAAFHRFNEARVRAWPYAQSATSTHDTKRSEDARARIHVLSELPVEWAQRLRRWSRWNRPSKRLLGRRRVPDNAEEAFLYQTLVGVWPLDPTERAGLPERLRAYVVKAAREAKRHTSWLDPRPDHEAALQAFVDALLDPAPDNRFLADFARFHEGLALPAALGSLALVLLKIAAPGVPDFYQGSELWDFSLVDPDNRRRVDFPRRQQLLKELRPRAEQERLALARELLEHWQDGRIKLLVTWLSLDFRRDQASLFRDGDYLPIRCVGRRSEHICAFARRHGQHWALIAVPRLCASLAAPGRPPLGRETWEDTALVLPKGAPERWRNVLTGEPLAAGPRRTLLLARVYESLPLALLEKAPPAS